MRTPPAAQAVGDDPCSILPPDTYFLVLEYALLGPLNKYLEDKLQGDESDWLLLVRLMNDIAVGVYEMHERGVLHRQGNTRAPDYEARANSSKETSTGVMSWSPNAHIQGAVVLLYTAQKP
jgi:hypothetical protein